MTLLTHGMTSFHKYPRSWVFISKYDVNELNEITDRLFHLVLDDDGD